MTGDGNPFFRGVLIKAKTKSAKGATIAAVSVTMLIAMSLGATVGFGGIQSAEAAFPGENGRIAFSSNKEGNTAIYVMNADGSGQMRLTESKGDTYPSWSPDGTRIAFTSQFAIYVMNADGTGQMRLTGNGTGGTHPSFSPDGSKILFTNGDIYIMNADGTKQLRLTNGSGYDAYPSFSPDGSKIAFFSDRDDRNFEIYVMNADGTNQTRLTNNDNDFLDVWPSFSPDGTKILFSSARSSTFEIYIMNADGTNQTQLTEDGFSDNYPSFSPDGSKIVFTSSRDGNSEIYIMNADGTSQTRLTATGNNVIDWQPNWGMAANTRQLAINSIDARGNSLSGMRTTVSTPDGILLQSGFTPLTFTGNFNTEYKVAVADYDGIAFVRWQEDNDGENNNNTRSRTFTLSEDSSATLTAVYDTGDSLRGFTSLAYVGTEEQPDLTVNSAMLNGSNNTLHMWTIIDPQQPTNSSSATTTYIVYATDRYQNFTFDHWLDTGSTDRFRTVTIDDNTTLSAYYRSEVLDLLGAEGKIAFSSDRDGGSTEIYVMNADGTGVTRLTNNEGFDSEPSWSGDGTMIAFASGRDGNLEIYIMNAADGTNQTNLTNSRFTSEEGPSFSPDGKKIIFFSDKAFPIESGGYFKEEIFIMNADGTNQTRLTNNTSLDFWPSFSPDGKKIAFISNRGAEGNYEVYVMNADGSDQTQLTEGARIDKFRASMPSWSPDGTKIVFTCFRYTGSQQVCEVDTRDGSQRALTYPTDSSISYDPSFSPDGSMIVFSSSRTGHDKLYVMNADGSKQTQLTTHPYNDRTPNWGVSPI